MGKEFGKSIKNYNTDNTKKIKSSENTYTTLMLINDLKKELQSISNYKITEKILSNFLGQKENLVTSIKKNIARNSRFQISKKELFNYKFNLRKILKEKSLHAIKLIEKYNKLNKLKLELYKIYNFHPNFNLHYFKDINTKEKAYWLGFIFADGSISYIKKWKKI